MIAPWLIVGKTIKKEEGKEILGGLRRRGKELGYNYDVAIVASEIILRSEREVFVHAG